MKKRINILGAAGGWEEAPYDDGEIWAVNNAHINIDRPIDLIIDIHDHCLNPKINKDKDSLSLIRDKGIPLVVRDTIKGMDTTKYPIEEIRKEFDTDYFGSGIDYMIALAIYQGATEIHLYGIVMSKGKEYAHQKPSVEFWLGIAKGRGVKVFVHGYFSTILKTRNYLMYGYELPQDFAKEHHSDQIELLDMLRGYEKDEKDNCLFYGQPVRGRT